MNQGGTLSLCHSFHFEGNLLNFFFLFQFGINYFEISEILVSNQLYVSILKVKLEEGENPRSDSEEIYTGSFYC